ncbi:MAG TPA: AbrB/MazE/SpoVT family DNA-binding domain-containing protein [Sphingomonas sp.]|jgi:hypothetical protein|nr:AbrB/MazE/SpoVT family DNA-binding domain-containing protein [Sphingomonas sp.]
MTDRAKIFWTGRSQAVRLPKQFRFLDEEVRIYRRDDGAVVLEPVGADRPVSEPREAAATAIDRLRTAISRGLDSGVSASWDVAEVKRLARGG